MSDTALLVEVIALVRGIDEKLTHHMRDEEAEIRSQSEAVEENNRRIDAMSSSIHAYMEKNDISKAFPNGDLIGHRVAHDEWIQTMQAIRGVFVDAGKAIAKAGIIGLTVFIVYAMWNGFLQGPK